MPHRDVRTLSQQILELLVGVVSIDGGRGTHFVGTLADPVLEDLDVIFELRFVGWHELRCPDQRCDIDLDARPRCMVGAEGIEDVISKRLVAEANAEMEQLDHQEKVLCGERAAEEVCMVLLEYLG